VPLKTCPHLSLLRPDEAPDCELLTLSTSKYHNLTLRFLPTAIDHNSECTECQTAIENWLCLICFKTFCSRYINEHSHLHFVSSEHPLTLSFSDLSVWCYKCEAYVDNPQLYKFKNLVHRSKFSEDLVWSYGDTMLINMQRNEDEESE
jgi:histone deacetylase 6